MLFGASLTSKMPYFLSFRSTSLSSDAIGPPRQASYARNDMICDQLDLGRDLMSLWGAGDQL